MIRMDTSTVNPEELGRLPELALPPKHTLGPPGVCCFLDPPGYPSYFMQPVYGPDGNEPTRRDAPRKVILGRVLEYSEGRVSSSGEWDRFWLRLPYEHPRVQAWIESVYQHYQGGYDDDAGKVKFKFEYDREKREFKDHPGFRDDWREKEKAAAAAFNEEIDRDWGRIAVPERLSAVRMIRRYYPEHQPNLEFPGRKWVHAPGWWSVLAECPKPEECPGEIRYPDRMWRHPINETWCQVCGWRKDA